jgi:hypothetical protein
VKTLRATLRLNVGLIQELGSKELGIWNLEFGTIEPWNPGTPKNPNFTPQKRPAMGKPADIKTKENNSSVEDFINSVPDEEKRNDSFAILEMMQKATNEAPKMWGGSLIGFGNKRYKSPASGREVDWFIIGFSPRKANFSLYLSFDLRQYAEKLAKLGKHKTGMGCLYINKLKDVDRTVLEEMIRDAAKDMERRG